MARALARARALTRALARTLAWALEINEVDLLGGRQPGRIYAIDLFGTLARKKDQAGKINWKPLQKKDQQKKINQNGTDKKDQLWTTKNINLDQQR